jgi:hypothetical protein
MFKWTNSPNQNFFGCACVVTFFWSYHYTYCFPLHGAFMYMYETTRRVSRGTKLLVLVIIVSFYSSEQPCMITFFWSCMCVSLLSYGFITIFCLITINISLLNFLAKISFLHCIFKDLGSFFVISTLFMCNEYLLKFLEMYDCIINMPKSY